MKKSIFFLLLLSLSCTQAALQLCHKELPRATIVTPALWAMTQGGDCVPIEITPESITIYGEQQRMVLHRDFLEIIPKNGEKRMQKRAHIGQYMAWIEAVEAALRLQNLRRGQCSTRQGIRRCHIRIDALQDLSISQHQDTMDRWVTRIRTTDQDASTLWWLAQI